MRLLAPKQVNYFYSYVPYYAFITLELFGLVFSDSAADHLELAKKFTSNGRYSDALPHLHDAINKDPSSYLTYFMRATVFLALNRHKSALLDLNKAHELNPKFTSALIQRANLRVKMGHLDEAHIDYEHILKDDPDNSEALRMYDKVEELRDNIEKVQDLLEENQYDLALKHMTAIVDDIPFNVELLRLRANTFEKVGEIRRAITDYKAVAKLSVDTSIYLAIAKLCYKLGEVQESLNNIRECLKLDPDHKLCMQFYKPTKKLNNNIQNMLDSKSSHDYEDCVAQGKSALKTLKSESGPQQLIYSLQTVICHCLSQAKDLIEGLKVCDAAIENSSENPIGAIAIEKPDLFCDKADILAEKEDYAEAQKMFQEALKLNKQHKRAREGADRMKKLEKQGKRRDYYKILGVNRNADEKEINRAYRKMAAKWHPDSHHDAEAKKKAEEMFMHITDAKAVLTDPEKRQRFDRGEDPLDIESRQQQQPHHGFYGNPFGQFGAGGAPFTFKFNFG